MMQPGDVEKAGGVEFDRIPITRVSSMNNVLSAPYFVLTLNEFTYGFQSISNLTRHRELDSFLEGGVNDHRITVGKQNDNSYEMTLTRGYVIHGPDLLLEKMKNVAASYIPSETARKAALIAASSVSPQSALEYGPAVGTIQVFSRAKKLIALFSFLSLGMRDWNLPELNSMSNEVFIESVTIVHTGLTMLPATWIPSIAQPLNSLSSEYDDGMDAMREIMEASQKARDEEKKDIEALLKKQKELDEKRLKLLHLQAAVMKKRRKAEKEIDEEDKNKEEKTDEYGNVVEDKDEEEKKIDKLEKELDETDEDLKKRIRDERQQASEKSTDTTSDGETTFDDTQDAADKEKTD